jgi:predicted nucleotide-binding protein
MNKEQKLQITNDIIEEAIRIHYSSKINMIKCIENAKSFIRMIFGEQSYWLGRIDKISWNQKSRTNLATKKKEIVTAWFLAKSEFIIVLTSINDEIEKYHNCISDKEKVINNNKIFIVHGHNDTIKQTVARVLKQLDLDPIILHEQPNTGKTIIEKFEHYSKGVCFAVVILSADDQISFKNYRARQNVIFELGYFISKLGRSNVVALYDTSSKEKVVELPSDISGVLYIEYDKPDGNWRNEVIKELKEVGFDIDANKLI